VCWQLVGASRRINQFAGQWLATGSLLPAATTPMRSALLFSAVCWPSARRVTHRARSHWQPVRVSQHIGRSYTLDPSPSCGISCTAVTAPCACESMPHMLSLPPLSFLMTCEIVCCWVSPGVPSASKWTCSRHERGHSGGGTNYQIHHNCRPEMVNREGQQEVRVNPDLLTMSALRA